MYHDYLLLKITILLLFYVQVSALLCFSAHISALFIMISCSSLSSLCTMGAWARTSVLFCAVASSPEANSFVSVFLNHMQPLSGQSPFYNHMVQHIMTCFMVEWLHTIGGNVMDFLHCGCLLIYHCHLIMHPVWVLLEYWCLLIHNGCQLMHVGICCFCSHDLFEYVPVDNS